MTGPARTGAKPYADPYVAGVALGLVLLSAFVLTGRGLGASGAFATTAAGTVAVMGAGAIFARGCTSGQALTGGALLSVGSWGFMASAFAAAYGVAPMLRRTWR